MFTRILIANRGEIACRIIRSCQRMGIDTVAVHSDADADALHVRLADQSCRIGPAASADSYLRGDRIIEAALRCGAQAVHPGYGFLSENEAFAEACTAAGLVFIGPPVTAIRAMGSKSAAKTLMEQAGVPLVPGYHGDEQSPDLLREQAGRIGYPVLIKATAGGGGKGMRIVESDAEFDAMLASCQREAAASFGDARVLVEKYLQRPRHIEIQVFGDSHGNLVHLHERDCSAQRRHQKVVEEAPAPGMDPERRAAMGQAACDAARAVGYVGAGTVEFIADADGAFYFMEMNTRLQVEHPVTEMITGIDLVEWQLRIASGEPLPLTQDRIPLRGHAIETRIYAEEPEKGFLPSIGTLAYCVPPTASAHVRIDAGVEQGDAIGPHYDPMIAKLIVWDDSREQAIERMLHALREFRIVGVGNNIGFLSRLVDHPAFRAGTVDTGLIGREGDALLKAPTTVPATAFQAAALWSALEVARQQQARAVTGGDPHSPWAIADGWRVNGALQRSLTFRHDEQETTVVLVHAGNGYRLDNQPASCTRYGDHAIDCRIGDDTLHATVVPAGEQLHVFCGDGHFALDVVDPLAHAGEQSEAHGGLLAPMPGRIVALLSEAGADVDKGTPLLVMEAMKMEYTLDAPARGTVEGYFHAVGDQVQDGEPLVDFKATT
ncbi:3-methylcrotonyl-CoA carboxylase [Pseudoxanthomonas kalamensis DSM 18571]|uniref:acetyl/propionyl/methylcrotonyl-CoA carboxylase subunit alpha n=1 Tax=Pseudoxanthomonas kalamensis TaxID=289483 RepID=UPI0013907487|nr:acetyl/propionyl/methylcrotonyl-CoA carboxylase subunit alpha [Pseudoxanthomonas kalamensis]KAF1711463.1 3-methylcrotonyl-CoA carboxylase [Pseudoxanthomonas kalamensis DSM 18571]